MSYNDGQDTGSYGGEDDGHRKRDTSRKRDGKKEKKDKGYQMFEEEDSEEDQPVLPEDVKSPSKSKKDKAKPSFKFPVRKEKTKEKDEKREKEAKKEDKGKKREEKEGKKTKEKKGKSKHGHHDPRDAAPVPSNYENPIFGVPLAVAVDRDKSHDGIELPAILRECIDYIEECGLACEGIYRISGVKSKVQALKDAYNRHQAIYLHEHEPNVVASLLKQFLRELPEPVLTLVLMPKFEESSTFKSNKKKVEGFTKLIADLPTCNRLLLSWMIVHMTHVIDLAKENKMTLQNVSIVLSPTMQISHRVLNVLFSNASALFGNVQLRKYVPPLKPANSKWSLELPDNLTDLKEELAKQESLLNQLHAELNSGLTDPVIEEQLWEVQRVVTQLKRKIKMAKKSTGGADQSQPSGDLRMSQTSLSSLSAPEELKLELRTAPVVPAASLATAPMLESKTVIAVIEPQPSAAPSDISENKVKRESRKSVKFDVDAEVDNDEKPEVVVSVTDETERPSQAPQEADKSVPKEGRETKEASDGDNAEEENEKASEDIGEVKDQEASEEVTASEMPTQEPPTANFELEVAEEHEGTAQKVEASDEALPVKPSKQSDEKENWQKPVALPEREEAEHKSASEQPASAQETDSKSPGVEKRAVPPPQPKAVERQDSQSLPPFTFTLLEPVKAEMPRPRKEEDLDQATRENMRKSEELRELEEELLGDRKPKKAQESPKENDENTAANDLELDKQLEEEYALVMEEEELGAIADELRQKIATERSEMERLTQEIQELQYLRQDSDLDDVSSDSNSSEDSEDEEDLQDLLVQVIQDNEELEMNNADLCQKIHEERMICLSVKLQIRLLQQKQLETSYG